MTINNLLFPTYQKGTSGFALLFLRVVFGLMLAAHGFQKLMNFSEMSAAFPDPLGIGAQLSLGLAVFGELFCSIAVIFGFLTRLAIIPMIFTMGVAFFVAHGGSFATGGELAFAYLIVFVFILWTGPGLYSIDTFIGTKLSERR